MTEPETPAANAVVHTIEHGEPSPLPENNWLWRRVYVFAVTVALCAHVWWLSGRVTDVYTLRMAIRNSQGLILVYALLYLAGASTEAISRMFVAAKTTRKEVITSAPPPASIDSSGGVTTPPDDGVLSPSQRFPRR